MQTLSQLRKANTAKELEKVRVFKNDVSAFDAKVQGTYLRTISNASLMELGRIISTSLYGSMSMCLCVSWNDESVGVFATSLLEANCLRGHYLPTYQIYL
jgi:hypothetical protein